MFTSLKRIFKNGWKIVQARAVVSIVVIATVTLVSLFLWQVVSLNFLINTSLKYVQRKLDFSIYFKEGTEEEDIKKLASILENFPKVDRAILVNKEKAFEEFKSESKKNPVLGQALQELKINPLTDYLIVRAADPKIYEEVANYLESSPYRSLIEFVTYSENQSIIKKFIGLSQKIKIMMTAVIIAIGLFGALVMFNSIILTIYSQREEIEILRLLGASNFFIRAPFLIFAFIVTVTGYLLGLLFLFIMMQKLNPLIITVVPEGNVLGYIFDNFIRLNLFVVSFLLFVNLIATWVSLQKYLKI